MLVEYSDIISRLGPPLWYDANGVPRYAPFKPAMCGIYVDLICYMEIACQACDRRFMVASESHRMDRNPSMALPSASSPGNPNADPWDLIGQFHYGDPPRHNGKCYAGDTMNSVPVKIVEFWSRDASDDWQRKPEHEVSFPALEADGGL